MKTYSESQKIDNIDWNQVLTGLEYGDDDFVDNLDHYEKASNDWVTCAVGNQCDVIPRSEVGAPEDKILSDLGQTFATRFATLAYNIQNNSGHHRLISEGVGDCYSTLSAIEERSTTLINEIQRGGSL